MAKILEEWFVLKITTLLQDEDPTLTVLTSDMKTQIVAFTQQTVGSGSIVEMQPKE